MSHFEQSLLERSLASGCLDRRMMLKLVASSLTATAFKPVHADDTAQSSRMGLVIYCYRFLREQRRKANPESNLFAPLEFLKQCQSVGAGGMQCQLGTLAAEEISQLRTFAEEHDLYIEAIVRLPKSDADLDRFGKELKTAKECGALAARTTIIPGRRYEYFDSLKKFREFEKRGEETLIRGAPIAERHRIPIAVENHKDQRNAARLKLLQRISSEYVGACVDTGNSIALLEDPIQTIRDFAPWAHSVHLKDQALKSYDDGFLLGDVPLGQGSLDLPLMVNILKKAKPDIRFTLELITRDPLKVPCLTDKYWATLPDLPAYELARTLRLVREHSNENGQSISEMSPKEQIARESRNVQESIQYSKSLGLSGIMK